MVVGWVGPVRPLGRHFEAIKAAHTKHQRAKRIRRSTRSLNDRFRFVLDHFDWWSRVGKASCHTGRAQPTGFTSLTRMRALRNGSLRVVSIPKSSWVCPLVPDSLESNLLGVPECREIRRAGPVRPGRSMVRLGGVRPVAKEKQVSHHVSAGHATSRAINCRWPSSMLRAKGRLDPPNRSRSNRRHRERDSRRFH